MGDFSLAGHAGQLRATCWPVADPRYVLVISHGYGQHVHVYDRVAAAFNGDGASVYAVDHTGHGLSEGERAVIDDVDSVVDDFHLLVRRAREQTPGVPVVMLGHSMGGLIGARYLQRYGDECACGVLSAPGLSPVKLLDPPLAGPQIPDLPFDTALLSRDPDVGRAHLADPLIWHGPFKRPLLEAFKAGTKLVAHGGRFTVPVLWLHGDDDQIVDLDTTRAVWEVIEGTQAQAKVYPGARHELLFETNKAEVFADVTAFIHQFL